MTSRVYRDKYKLILENVNLYSTEGELTFSRIVQYLLCPLFYSLKSTLGKLMIKMSIECITIFNHSVKGAE